MTTTMAPTGQSNGPLKPEYTGKEGGGERRGTGGASGSGGAGGGAGGAGGGGGGGGGGGDKHNTGPSDKQPEPKKKKKQKSKPGNPGDDPGDGIMQSDARTGHNLSHYAEIWPRVSIRA